MKKLLLACLSLFLSTSYSLVSLKALQISNEEKVEAQISKLTEGNLDIVNTYPLYDINNEYSYDLYEFSNGYAVATHTNGYISELMLDCPNPYVDVLQHKLYYMGPYNYLYEEDSLLKDVNSKECLNMTGEEMNEDFNMKNEDYIQQIKNINSEILTKKVSPIETYGDNKWHGTAASRFSRYKNWKNTNNTCGPHAAAVILAYSDDYINDKIVPSNIRKRNSTSAGTLIKKLIQNTTNATSTRPVNVSNGMWSIISINAGFDYTSGYQSVGTTWSKAVSMIKSYRGCVGIGLLSALGSPKKYGNHWVVAYQYKENSSNKGYFKCHDNHGSYTAVIEASWTCGLVWISKK